MGDSAEVRASVSALFDKFKVLSAIEMACLVCGELLPVGMFAYDRKTKSFTEEKDITLAAFYYAALGHEIECDGSR